MVRGLSRLATLVHRRPPLRDFDNAVASLKEVVDALITGGLIVSDAPKHLKLDVVQVLGPKRGVTIEVWPADVDVARHDLETAGPGGCGGSF